MTANDLRIGNLVYHPLTKENLRIKQNDLCDFANGFIFIDAITLTEELLLKFGFTLCENAAWYEKKIPTLGIVVSCNLHGRFCIEHTDEIVTIRDCCYKVHELQNLYFALVREELTLKSEL